MPESTLQRFTAPLYAGHSDCAVVVPFDPAAAWGTPAHRIGYRQHRGHAVQGTVDGVPFVGWIWFYFREWRLVLPRHLLRAAGAAAGDVVTIRVKPHPDPAAVPPYTPGG